MIFYLNNTKILIGELLRWPLGRIDDQRSINSEWVARLKRIQYEYRNKFGVFCFPGSIILGEYNNNWYLVDGQHRMQVLKEISYERPEINNYYITIEMYQCGDNLNLLRSIYAMANDRYITNGAINKEGTVYTNNDCASQVVKWLQNTYPLQTSGSSAPKFDCNLLSKYINESGKINNGNITKFCCLIETVNREYAQILYNKDRTQYDKCLKLSGFFLPYKQPKCKWIEEILVRI